MDDITSSAVTKPFRSVGRTNPQPVSSAQLRIWFLDRLAGGKPTYNLPIVVRLQGTLDRAALEAALADVVARHESLRTVFADVEGRPVQHVLGEQQGRPVLEVHRVDPPQLERELAAAAARPFDLATETPLRASLFELTEDEHVLLLLLHRIACDGWSAGPLGRDLMEFYNARCRGAVLDRTEPAVRYADHILRRQRQLGDPGDRHSLAARQLTYWRTTLSGMGNEIALPFDRSRPAKPSFRGDSVRFEVASGVHARLAELAQRTGTTMFTVLHAGLAVLLGRLTGEMDIAIGTPVPGRTHSGSEDLVGHFANTVVLRTDLAGTPTFADLLHKVHAVDLAAFAHQDVPFEQVVEAVNPERVLGRNPLVQVFITAQSLEHEWGLTGLRTTASERPFGAVEFDLSFNFDPRYEPDGTAVGIVGEARFSTDLFDRTSVETIAERLVRVLTAVAADATPAVGDIDVLSTAERETLLSGWNDTAREVCGQSVPELLEARAAKTPDAVAVRIGYAELTYGELNAKANRVARYLISRGAGPESVVALSMPRSVDLVVAVWGTLKAGAAYCPIDPEYPVERVSFMLADCGAQIVLKEPVHARDMADTNLTDADRVIPLLPGHPCYVIYTSGSTGVPKAVVMHGAALVNLMSWYQRAGEKEGWSAHRTANFSSISFDMAIMEILISTVRGGCLEIPEEETRRDLHKLVTWLAENEVNEIFVPNLVLAALVDASGGTAGGLPRLRHVVQGGEAFKLTAELAAFRRAVPDRRLMNYYGPTETHVATAAVLPSDPDEWPAEAPIGRPIDNTRTYVLDRWLKPVPVGVPGELYIAGAQLARGYLKRPDATAARYVPDPFGEPGTRMYRTGDVVRWCADGQLMFVGRVDDQLKIRGFRVEPGEVEAVLRRHEEVVQVAVIAVRERSTSAKRLVAYVVPATATLTPAVLRRHAAEFLPHHMVPKFRLVDRLPLTPNGKLDRGALPALTEEAGRPPSSRVEHEVCDVFAEVLEKPVADVDQNFFASGGHSLGVLRVVYGIQRRLEVSLPVTAVFEHPTPAGIARALGQAEGLEESADPATASATHEAPRR
ncbi:non-ribosomal peptide synthetase [Streptomyces sp. NBC_01235]|uniref:non-ribosomal peptide synthetase n=1 Tax=Streptomyces sp. NBC_01235 TaxID=2903788 RepID=UPI002E1315F0|nr:amino acid adenylation domain-containing protein [Streptomyces sp. NBC_01235]